MFEKNFEIIVIFFFFGGGGIIEESLNMIQAKVSSRINDELLFIK